MRTVLTIAGSDSSGGAGVQADIKTITCNGIYATSVITALTAQNTTGIRDVLSVPPEFVANQLDSVLSDIKVDAVKIGMINNPEQVDVIYQAIKKYRLKNIVVDTVMFSTNGTRLMDDGTMIALKNKIFSLSSVITPNISEAEYLSSIKITNRDSVEGAAKALNNQFDCPVLIKGGHLTSEEANDYLYNGVQGRWIEGRRLDNVNTHGTGCTLSSAIAANLAKGYSLTQSIVRAKVYISGAIGDNLIIGKGRGPMNLAWSIKETQFYK